MYVGVGMDVGVGVCVCVSISSKINYTEVTRLEQDAGEVEIEYTQRVIALDSLNRGLDEMSKGFVCVCCSVLQCVAVCCSAL